MKTLNQFTHPEKFTSVHFLHHRTPDGKELLNLTGIALVEFSDNEATTWKKETYELILDLKMLPNGKIFRLTDGWTVLVVPVNIENLNVSNNNGIAVNQFRLANENPGLGIRAARIQCDLAVRDSDAWLHRVAYQVTLVGYFANA
jgi:hypothetical protein